MIVVAGWLFSAFSVLGAVGYVTGLASGGSETPGFVLLELGIRFSADTVRVKRASQMGSVVLSHSDWLDGFHSTFHRPTVNSLQANNLHTCRSSPLTTLTLSQ